MTFRPIDQCFVYFHRGPKYREIVVALLALAVAFLGRHQVEGCTSFGILGGGLRVGELFVVECLVVDTRSAVVVDRAAAAVKPFGR